jgi:hypothetical protein
VSTRSAADPRTARREPALALDPAMQRLFAAAQADMQAGQWEGATAKLEILAVDEQRVRLAESPRAFLWVSSSAVARGAGWEAWARRWCVLAIMLLASGAGVVIPQVLAATSAPVAEGAALPDTLRYTLHAVAGRLLNTLGGAAEAAAVQWVKAAAHAQSPAEVEQAAQGIANARRRDRATVDPVLCEQAAHGAPQVRQAIARAGLPCLRH